MRSKSKSKPGFLLVYDTYRYKTGSDPVKNPDQQTAILLGELIVTLLKVRLPKNICCPFSYVVNIFQLSARQRLVNNALWYPLDYFGFIFYTFHAVEYDSFN